MDTVARARLVDTYSPGARVVRAKRLRGGLGATTQLLTLEDTGGRRSRAVLRVYLPGGSRGSPERAEREYRTLQLCAEAGIPAPQPLFLDTEGKYLGRPALLLSYLPGRSIYRAAEAPRWAEDLARAMLRVHAVTPDRYDLSFLRPHGRDELARDLAKLHEKVDSHEDRLAREALSVLESRLDDIEWMEPCLVHEDFWSGNTVWFRGRISGVIDWSEATLGDPRFDPPQCAIDAFLANNVETANAIREAYLRLSPRPVPALWYFEVWVGLQALLYYELWLLGYYDAGLTYVTKELALERIRAFLRRAMDEGATRAS